MYIRGYKKVLRSFQKNSKKSKQKRVECQKFVRTKLEQKRYLGLFGLTENIELVGEEELVLQREFRIDFVLQKVEPTVAITGIFSHFKQYNILEFKSVNETLTAILLVKYIGQLFWWLFAKNTEAKENKSNEIREDEVTLNIVTVGRPRNVINKLDEILGDRFIRQGGGRYQYDVQGVEVHLLVINEFPVEREYSSQRFFCISSIKNPDIKPYTSGTSKFAHPPFNLFSDYLT